MSSQTKAIALLLILTALVFLHAVLGQFVWDDRELIVHNRYIRDFRSIPYLFSPDYWRHHHMSAGEEYRPLVKVSYALDCAFWHLSPRGFHLTNLAAYLGCVVVVFLIAQKLLGARSLAALTAFLFATHPSHVECVAYVKNRAEISAAVFGLLALWFFIARSERPRGVASTLGCCLVWMAALLSKKGSLALVAVFILWLWLLCPTERRRSAAWAFAPLLAIWMAYTAFLVISLKSAPVPAPSLGAAPKVLSHYSATLFFPVQSCAYPLPDSTGPAIVWVSVAALLLLALTLLVAAHDRRLLAFALLWLLATAAPALAAIHSLRPIADQRMFLPSVAACIFFALSASVLRTTHYALRITSCAPLILFAMLSIHRTFAWRSDLTLWRDTVAQAPANGRAQNNLGLSYLEDGRRALAARRFHAAIALDPRDINPLFNLAQLYEREGKLALARQTYEKLLAIEHFAPARERLTKLTTP